MAAAHHSVAGSGPPPVPPRVSGRLPEASRIDVRPRMQVGARWWTSTGISLVVHVTVLVMLALVMASPQVVQPRRPIEIVQGVDEGEPLPFIEPEHEVIEMPEPVAPAPVPDLAEEAAADVDEDPTATMATNFVFDTEEPSLAALDVEGVLAPVDIVNAGRELGASGPGGRGWVGGVNGAGEVPGGFGGEVGRRLAKAGAQTGDVQVSLSWDNFNDIDLHVIAPSGEHIFFGHRWSACRGMLDVDMNAGGPATREPVENVFWPAQAAPWGEYQVFVHHFARWDQQDATEFQVHVLVNGERRTFSGVVRAGQPEMPVARFTKNGFAGRGQPSFGE